MMRLLWVFHSQLVTQLFLGYELDKSLALRKTEKTILEYLYPSRTPKILADSSEILSIEEQGIKTKYSRYHSKEELDAEIQKIKEEIRMKQLELAHVENLIFLSSHSSVHQKYSESEPPAQQAQLHDQSSENAVTEFGP